jgi:hypothetical protein
MDQKLSCDCGFIFLVGAIDALAALDHQEKELDVGMTQLLPLRRGFCDPSDPDDQEEG